MEPVVTVASAHQWDGEKNQREAPGGLVSLAAVLPKLTGLKVRWLKLPALESGLRSPVFSCATLRKLINLPGPQFPQL